MKLICCSCGSVVPQFPTLHLYPDWSEAEPEALQEEVQHVGAAGQIVKVYVEVFVEVYTHVIWIFFFVFLSDLVAQLEVMVLLMMRDSLLWDPHLDLYQALGLSQVVLAVPEALVCEEYDRSRDLDRCHCCLPVCGGWSSSPSLIGIGFS